MAQAGQAAGPADDLVLLRLGQVRELPPPLDALRVGVAVAPNMGSALVRRVVRDHIDQFLFTRPC